MEEIALFGELNNKTLADVRKKLSGKAEQADDSSALRLVSNLPAIATGDVVPFRCFPLAYILGQDGLPVHCSISIQGPTESCKSSLFWTLARIVLSRGGFVAYFDMESKHDNVLAQSYIGNPIAGQSNPPLGRCAIYSCDGPEAFAVSLDRFSKAMLKFCEKAGKNRPILIGVDTLGSTVSESYSKKLRTQGDAEPGYAFAQTIKMVQAALMSWIKDYQQKLPATLVLLAQERENKETGEKRATGGAFAGYSKSIGLSMRRIGKHATLDEDHPTLRLRQEKQSKNTKRNIGLVLQARCYRNPMGFKEYSLDWGLAMVQLLSDVPPSMLNGLFKVTMPTKTKVSVSVEAKAKRSSELGVKYKCSSEDASDVGWRMLADNELHDELCRRLNVDIHTKLGVPYEMVDSMSGKYWLSPDEYGYLQLGKDKDGKLRKPETATQAEIDHACMQFMVDQARAAGMTVADAPEIANNA